MTLPASSYEVPRTRAKHKLPSLIAPTEHAEYVRSRHPGAELETCQGVVLLYQDSVLRRAVARYQPTLREGWCRGELWLTEHEGVRVALCGRFGLGAPAAALVLEQLASLGASAVIAVGTAAALTPELGAGSVVLCDQALRDEGTSHHYAPPTLYAYADPNLTSAYAHSMTATGLPFTRATSWTTDAPYRETEAEVVAYQRCGLAAADMEASALFTVARYRGVAASVGMAIADSLVERGPRQARPEIASSLDRLVDAALMTFVS
ncbi:nucleoside phosphorylase [Streptomyces sp. NPDC059917]|uniref:nucleoside phosphorylase n=1 Tax=Streptomyces sp. NPDC059917 TaxID=3347002 RepID=UPI003646BDB0